MTPAEFYDAARAEQARILAAGGPAIHERERYNWAVSVLDDWQASRSNLGAFPLLMWAVRGALIVLGGIGVYQAGKHAGEIAGHVTDEIKNLVTIAKWLGGVWIALYVVNQNKSRSARKVAA